MDLAGAAVAASARGDNGRGGAEVSGGYLTDATWQITQAITDRRNHLYDNISSKDGGITFSDDSTANLAEVPRPVLDALTLTHATTTEFLHHFWLAFLSGDERRAADLQALVGSLRRSFDRVEAVAKQAEEEKEKEKERRRQAALAEYKATGRKRRKGADDNITGGRRLVEDVLGPTMKAVDFAVRKWEEAVREAGGEVGGRVGGGAPPVGVPVSQC